MAAREVGVPSGLVIEEASITNTPAPHAAGMARYTEIPKYAQTARAWVVGGPSELANLTASITSRLAPHAKGDATLLISAG